MLISCDSLFNHSLRYSLFRYSEKNKMLGDEEFWMAQSVWVTTGFGWPKVSGWPLFVQLQVLDDQLKSPTQSLPLFLQFHGLHWHI